MLTELRLAPRRRCWCWKMLLPMLPSFLVVQLLVWRCSTDYSKMDVASEAGGCEGALRERGGTHTAQ